MTFETANPGSYYVKDKDKFCFWSEKTKDYLGALTSDPVIFKIHNP